MHAVESEFPHLARSLIGYGFGRIGIPFMTVFSIINGYPSAEAFKDLPAAEAAALKTGPWVLFVLYFFLTVAELFISPLGLSFVSKVAPKHLQGLCKVCGSVQRP